MSTADAVTVIIVAYNSRRALERQVPHLSGLPHLIVIDNASVDGTADWLHSALPQARVLRMAQNVGFGRAHNVALAQCTTPFALLLNPDCLIAPEAIASLAQCLDRHADALMSVPRLLYPDGRAQENHRAFFHTRESQRPAYCPPAGETCCEMVSGAVLMVRVECFRRIGGFDPWFFLYWEDEDVCIRARQQRLAIILAPQAVACHVAQTSSSPSARTTFIRHYSYITSKLYLRRKLGETRLLLIGRGLGTLLSSVVALLVSAITGRHEKTVRSAARIAAVLTAPWQLRRKEASATPRQLWS